ncbi:unnamed protein product, partial [Vitis vinifera]|uniref:Uncharacterized protein n=1 Tax=Vitis vinifera TaxID=29760 RepID=D7U999_VITVI
MGYPSSSTSLHVFQSHCTFQAPSFPNISFPLGITQFQFGSIVCPFTNNAFSIIKRRNGGLSYISFLEFLYCFLQHAFIYFILLSQVELNFVLSTTSFFFFFLLFANNTFMISC